MADADLPRARQDLRPGIKVGSGARGLGQGPARFFRPPYLGGRGWVGVVLAGPVDWAELEALVRRSFSLVAPKRVAALLAEPE